MKTILALLLIISTHLYADEASEIMQKVDNNIRGKDIYIRLSMKVVALGHERIMKMESWSQGSKKSFVKVLYPPKDKGITFLSLNNQMWQYVPKIERIIKIPPSMMLQNWMGSDITNDDVVKQSSIVEDYDAKIIKRDGELVTLELIPKEDAPVVWGKVIINVDTRTYTSTKDVFYDEEGKEVRFFLYENVKKFGEYYLPTYWRVQPSDKQNKFTEIILDEVVYDKKISEQYFKKSALKRFSR